MRATLTYHSIDDSGSPISVARAAFDAHAAWLAKGRVRVLPLDELVHSPASTDAVALTFDDGFANILEPVTRLRALGLPVTIFVVTGRVGCTNAWHDLPHAGIPTLPLLGWSDLERLMSLGASLEAHTVSHAALTDLGEAALEDELAASQAELARRFGVRPTHVAYPYGDVDDRVVRHARRYYACGHTTEFARIGTGDDMLRVPRLDMYYFRTHDGLEGWGRPSFARRLTWIGARRRLRHVVIGGPHPAGRRTWTR